MKEKRDYMHSLSIQQTALYTISLFAILMGLFFSVLSWLGTCTESCSEGLKYHLFGYPFSIGGIVYFSLLFVLQLFARIKRNIFFFSSFLLAIGLGAEILFIVLQKIHHTWCPLCLGIATSLFIACLATALIYFQRLSRILPEKEQSHLFTVCLTFPSLFLGVIIAVLGITKLEDAIDEKQYLLNNIAFGDLESPVDIYVFTSWTCPACQKLEPRLEKMTPEMFENAKVTFIDYGEDMTTLNFLPYNLSFMINNKSAYVSLRQMLKEIASSTATPSESEIEKAVQKRGLNYTQLNYSDIAFAIEFFKEKSNEFKVHSIPAFVIINKMAKKEVILTGLNITKKNLRKAIHGEEVVLAP